MLPQLRKEEECRALVAALRMLPTVSPKPTRLAWRDRSLVGEAAGQPLLLGKDGAGGLVLDWAPSCVFADRDYAVYRGNLGSFETHSWLTCSTEGATELTVDLPRGSVYFLVVPRNELREGSYGVDGDGDQRPPGAPACLPQLVVPCN